MKLYHYAPCRNTIFKRGLFSFAGGYGEVDPYVKRAESSDRQKIIFWMEKTFPGRSHAISMLTEPIKWQNNDPMLKEFIDNHELFSIELDELLKDNLVESIWCQDGERLSPVQPTEIDLSPLPWEKCNRERGLFFGVIRHYFIVLKNNVLPPRYIKTEKIYLDTPYK